MYVRKFEAETMDQALQEIKQELGPDAIILKTKTNKGLGGSFKKGRVEVTAAISEKNYTKKSLAEQSMSETDREKFYQSPSSHISSMLDNFSDSGTATHEVKNPGYGNLALNKAVKTVKDVTKKAQSSLDDFLSQEPMQEVRRAAPVRNEVNEIQIPTPPTPSTQPVSNPVNTEFYDQKIEFLEKKVLELSRTLNTVVNDEPEGVREMRTVMRSLSIDESYIQELIRKSIFELGNEELRNFDSVFEYCLKEMFEKISTKPALFTQNDIVSPITIVLSETSNGQSSMLYKLAALKENCVIISYGAEDNRDFVKSMFDIKVEHATTAAEVVSLARNYTEAKTTVFIDYKNSTKEINEAKNFIEGLKRSFDQVETLICLSAIHSEIYNKSIVTRYGQMANGLVLNMLDLCLDYGPIFNISLSNSHLPMVFFGTGTTVPDDIESATKERILAGMFKLN
jgi:flagellar biosynthesis GTPase FlhF